jgi:hypothetical protein
MVPRCKSFQGDASDTLVPVTIRDLMRFISLCQILVLMVIVLRLCGFIFKEPRFAHSAGLQG